MKKRSLFIVALCACTAFFCERDTKSPELWPRSVEPLLSNVSEWKACNKTLVPGRVVGQAQCGAPEPPPAAETEPCDELIEDHTRALRILSFEPHCTDSVIDALERFGRVDPKAMSDLAAAYYVRAQREDRPSDFLRALEAAEQAVAAEPELPAAHFNRALVLEELGLSGQAIAAWDQFLRLADSRWEKEAQNAALACNEASMPPSAGSTIAKRSRTHYARTTEKRLPGSLHHFRRRHSATSRKSSFHNGRSHLLQNSSIAFHSLRPSSRSVSTGTGFPSM